MVLACLLARLTWLGRVAPLLLLLSLAACDSGQTSGTTSKVLEMPSPEDQAKPYLTDQADIAGQTLSLWYEDGGCKLDVSVKSVDGASEGGMRWLKPTGPCYFIRSPGSKQVQVYLASKARRVVAVLGTPVAVKRSGARCGQELQGLIMDGGGKVAPSSNTRSGSVYCADQGLDNFQYSLFSE